MKRLEWLIRKDADNGTILLLLAAIAIYFILFQHLGSSSDSKAPSTKMRLNVQYQFITLERHCYAVPYSKEQLEKIWDDNGKTKSEINRILREEVKGVNLSTVVAPPIMIYAGDTSSVCLDFKYTVTAMPPAPENHLM